MYSLVWVICCLFTLVLQEHATVRQSVVEVLLEMAKYTDVYLMETVLDDESEVHTYTSLTENHCC